MPFFPIFINLDGYRILIVGGGHVACRKAQQLAEYTRNITAVSPVFTGDFQKLKDRISLKQRAFSYDDLLNADLVIAATDDGELNSGIYRRCHESGIPVNVVDCPENCDFYFPALVRRDDLVIGITSSGRAPGVSGTLRKILDDRLPRHAGELLSEIGKLRKKILAEGGRPAENQEYSALIEHFAEEIEGVFK